MQLQSDVMTPEVLWSMGRIGEYSISPDKSQIVYNVTYYSVEENRSSSTLYIMNADGSDNKVLSTANASEYSPQWRPDGKKIGFLCAESGAMQLWEINPDGTKRRQVSDLDGDGITGFSYAPDLSQIIFTKEVKLKTGVADSAGAGAPAADAGGRTGADAPMPAAAPVGPGAPPASEPVYDAPAGARHHAEAPPAAEPAPVSTAAAEPREEFLCILKG